MRRCRFFQDRPIQHTGGYFLIALRMKRETMPENSGVLDALFGAYEPDHGQSPACTDLADPYDGFTRGMPAAAFLPPVLAACGILHDQ